MKEVSAGGVVVFNNAILLLKKFNGDWVLPKGRIEPGETLEETALREVFEESGAKCEIIKYVARSDYKYRSYKFNQEVEKTVHWYLMTSHKMDCKPLKKEGFIEATFVHKDRASSMLKHDDERKIIEKTLELL